MLYASDLDVFDRGRKTRLAAELAGELAAEFDRLTAACIFRMKYPIMN
jgi:hypothetical protein